AMRGGYPQAPRSVERPEARAEDAHPADLAVALGQVGLLLDEELAVGIVAAEAVTDPLAVRERVALEVDQLLDLVGVVEPGSEHALDHVGGVVRLPDAPRRECAEVDLRM